MELVIAIQDFIDSTSVARVNGFLTGHGSVADFDSDIDKLGLSDQSIKMLTDVYYNYKKKAV